MPRCNKLVTGGALSILAAALAGCGTHAGSFDVDDGASTKFDNLAALVQFKQLPRQPRPTDAVKCPEIVVQEGTTADRVNAGSEQTNNALRYQFAVEDVARDCIVEGGQLSMKVGVSGKALLGPAGSPGSFSAPVRVVVVRAIDQSPVVTKLYQVPTSVAAGQTQGTFTLVTDPLSVPNSNAMQDYMIKVGFDVVEKKKPNVQAQQVNSTAQSPASSDRPHRHHRHMNSDQAQQ